MGSCQSSLRGRMVPIRGNCTGFMVLYGGTALIHKLWIISCAGVAYLAALISVDLVGGGISGLPSRNMSARRSTHQEIGLTAW